MKKLLIAASAAAMVCGAFAQEAKPAGSQNANEAKAELEEKDESPFEAGFDVDLFTAYVWRSSVQSDRPVAQPCVWGDWTFADPFSVGFFVWQNYDLTGRRRDAGFRGEWNETDYNIHAGADLWSSDDEETTLSLEVGHDWYTYNAHGTWDEEDGGYRKRKDWPTTYELYVKLSRDNPYVTPYAQLSHEYNRIDGTYYEFGLKREVTLADLFDSESDLLSQLTLSGDVNVNFGCDKYFEYLYLAEGAGGIGGVTAKMGLAWAPCDHFSIGGLLAFTSVLGEDCRDGMHDGDDWCDSTDIVWGGVQAKIGF